MRQYRREIERGAAFLDEKRPGWRDRVDVDALDLTNCTSCVLGQLAGGLEADWAVVLQRFSLVPGEEDALGFNTWGDSVEWAALTEEWREYIAETRAVA